MLRHLVNIFLFYLPPSRLFALRRFLLKFSGVEVAKGVSFCGRGWIYGRGKLVIGHDTWLSPGAIFYTHVDASIVIGSSCDIGPNVEFIIGSHLTGDASRRAGEGTATPITIGNGCWIGAGCKILDGVYIGSGCVVGAGAVVTRDMPANCLVAGVPAKIKKSYEADA